MTIIETAHVPTANGGKYVRQLCKHWSHKFDVELSGDAGTVSFADAVATMAAAPDLLTVTVAAADDATVERIKSVVASHLDRFAFREAPLRFGWSRN